MRNSKTSELVLEDLFGSAHGIKVSCVCLVEDAIFLHSKFCRLVFAHSHLIHLNIVRRTHFRGGLTLITSDCPVPASVFFSSLPFFFFIFCSSLWGTVVSFGVWRQLSSIFSWWTNHMGLDECPQPHGRGNAMFVFDEIFHHGGSVLQCHRLELIISITTPHWEQVKATLHTQKNHIQA